MEPTDRERIEAAASCATIPGQSPAMTLHRVMAVLGYDVGDPAETEHQVMQFYADPANNPFVQAQIEAKLLLDAGHLERLGQTVKRLEPSIEAINALFGAVQEVQADIDEFHTVHHSETRLLKNIARAVVVGLAVGITRNGVNVFNDALGEAVDHFIEEFPRDDISEDH